MTATLRNHFSNQIQPKFPKSNRYIVLRGKTGVGKTLVLKALSVQGVQILDIEHFANHRGSVFGGLGMPPQPSHKSFQKTIITRLNKLNPQHAIFCEHSGPYLGSVGLPQDLYHCMMHSDWILLTSSTEKRIQHLINSYHEVSITKLHRALDCLKNRLDENLLQSLHVDLDRRNLAAMIRKLLPYYDDAYSHQIQNSKGRMLFEINTEHISDMETAAKILKRLA